MLGVGRLRLTDGRPVHAGRVGAHYEARIGRAGAPEAVRSNVYRDGLNDGLHTAKTLSGGVASKIARRRAPSKSHGTLLLLGGTDHFWFYLSLVSVALPCAHPPRRPSPRDQKLLPRLLTHPPSPKKPETAPPPPPPLRKAPQLLKAPRLTSQPFFCLRVILSPRESAMPCVLERMRM